MKNDTELLLETLEDLNTLYIQQGNKMFPSIQRLLKVRPGAKIGNNYVDKILELQSKNPSFDKSSRLIRTYVDQIETGKLNKNLHLWVKTALLEIADGQSPIKAFSLKRPAQRPKHTVSLSDLRICSAYEIQRRKSLPVGKIQERLSKDMGVSPKTIQRSVKKLSIPSHIETDLLKELALRDYADLLN